MLLTLGGSRLLDGHAPSKGCERNKAIGADQFGAGWVKEQEPGARFVLAFLQRTRQAPPVPVHLTPLGSLVFNVWMRWNWFDRPLVPGICSPRIVSGSKKRGK